MFGYYFLHSMNWDLHPITYEIKLPKTFLEFYIAYILGPKPKGKPMITNVLNSSLNI